MLAIDQSAQENTHMLSQLPFNTMDLKIQIVHQHVLSATGHINLESRIEMEITIVRIDNSLLLSVA